MASYTDKIPTFNPYVEQQPVDAMLKVGVYKQQKYEEGVKKIQTNIDNVAGLDIANPVQQKYLQSKLDALGNNLTFLAAGDFSDFSLVNSVNGMTKQITKDEDVINAVSSTAKLRAGYKSKAELAKKGLTDKNNDDYYDMYASEYVNSKDLKASFNADYVPYTNIVKKLKEALVGVGQSETIAEQIFVTGADGKPLIGPDGKYTYADAKTIEKLVTNKPAVIAAINNVLNEGNVKQQIGIDGWATYRNTEATTLLEPLKADYDNERSRLQQQGLQITAMLNGTNITPEQRQMYIDAASENEAALLKNDNTFMTLSKEAEDSPESFKQNYYTQEFKQRLLNQFLDEDSSTTYGTNEALQQQNYRDDMAFKKQQERNKIAYENANLALARSANDLAWLKFTSDYEQDPTTGNFNKKPEPAKKGTAGTFDANKPLFSGSNPGDKASAINIIQTDINTLGEQKNEMAKSLFFDFVRTWKDKDLSDEQILTYAKTWAKQAGVTTEVYLDRWASDIKNRYDYNGVTPPPNINDEFDAYINTSSSLNNKKNQYDTAKIESDKEFNIEGKIAQLIKEKEIPTQNFNVNGITYTITPEDMLNMSRGGIIKSLAIGSYNNKKDANGNFKIDDPNNVLTANQKNTLQQWYKMSPQMRSSLYNQWMNLRWVTDDYRKVLDGSKELLNNKLSKVVGVSDTVVGFLPMDSELKPTTIGKVAAYVNSGERNYGEGADKTKVLKVLDEAKTISWKGKKPTNSTEDWMGEIIVDSKDGDSYTITNVNRTDLETFTDAKFTQYQEKPIQDALNMNEKTKSTNPVYMPGSPNAWKTAYFKGTNINPAVIQAGWSYRADVVKTRGGYRLVNYVRPPGATGYTTIYGAAIANDENIIDNIYKTTSPAELSAMYLNYLHNQTKQ